MKRRAGRWLLWLGLAAAVVLAVAALSGHPLNGRLGPIRVRVHDPSRPLAVAAALVTTLVLVGRRSSSHRAIAIAAAAGVAGLGLASFAAAAPPSVPIGDLALIESYTRHAMDGQMFVGPYSRFIWNHPGPLYFFLLAPVYALSGSRPVGLSAGALAINLAAAWMLLWIVWRCGRPRLAVLVSLATLVYVVRIQESLATAWNPHVLTLPLMALVAVSAQISTGQVSLLPVAALLGTFLMQTHVAVVPVAAALLIAAPAAAARRGELRGRLRRAVNIALWLALLFWLLPIAEQLHQRPGNLTAIARFFLFDERPRPSFGTAFNAWAAMLVGLLRPDFSVAGGGALTEATRRVVSLSALALVALVALAFSRSRRDGDRFGAAMAALVLLSMAISLLAVLRIRDEVIDHTVFWISGTGALAVPLAVSGITIGRMQPTLRLASLVCALVAAMILVPAGRQIARVREQAARPRGEHLAATRLWEMVDAYRRQYRIGRPLIRIDHPAWSDAAAITLQLQKAGVAFAVEEAYLSMFSEAVRATGNETSTLVVAWPERRNQLLAEPGYQVIAQVGRTAVLLGPAPRQDPEPPATRFRQ